jgi:hypothetical protein
MSLGPFDYVLWLIGFVVEVSVVVCSIYRKEFLRYLPLNCYMLFEALVTCGLYACLREFGFRSSNYIYFYYYTESLLSVLMFWVVIHLYQQVFREMGVSHHIRRGAAVLLVLTALFSYAVVHQNRTHLTSRFVVELGQNFNFIGVVLTYLLWGAVLKLRETRTRLLQLLLALGVYFSATAGTYALRNLFPALEQSILKDIFPIIGLWLPVAWAYTFAKVPEDARLMPARLMVKAR